MYGLVAGQQGVLCQWWGSIIPVTSPCYFFKSMIVRWTTNIMLHAMCFQCITAFKTFVLVHFMCTGYILVYKVFKCSGRCILKTKLHQLYQILLISQLHYEIIQPAISPAAPH